MGCSCWSSWPQKRSWFLCFLGKVFHLCWSWWSQWILIQLFVPGKQSASCLKLDAHLLLIDLSETEWCDRCNLATCQRMHLSKVQHCPVPGINDGHTLSGSLPWKVDNKHAVFGCVWSGLGTLGMPSCLAVFSNSYASWNLSVFRSWPFPVERCLGATGAEGQRQPVHRNDDLATLGVFL